MVPSTIVRNMNEATTNTGELFKNDDTNNFTMYASNATKNTDKSDSKNTDKNDTKNTDKNDTNMFSSVVSDTHEPGEYANNMHEPDEYNDSSDNSPSAWFRQQQQNTRGGGGGGGGFCNLVCVMYEYDIYFCIAGGLVCVMYEYDIYFCIAGG